MSFPSFYDSLHDILRWVLRGHMIDVRELLYFPAIGAILGPHPTDIGDQTVQFTRAFLANSVHRIHANTEGFLHRHQGTWLTIRSCTRSAIILLGAALMCQERNAPDATLLPEYWRAAVVQVLGLLKAWERESDDVRRLKVVVELLLGQCQDD